MINVAVIEDNAQYRTTIAIIMQLDERLRLIHKLENCDEMIGRFENEKPDVVLMDIDMPGMNGIQAVWEIKKHFPEIKVMMLTVFEDDEKIFGAIKAGANGYLLKKDSPQKIIAAVIDLYKGESAMNGVVAAKVLEYFQQGSKKSRELEESNLTKKESEILQLLIRGSSYKEIAASVFISVETLNSHIKNIYRKLNTHSRAEISARYGKV